MQLSSQLHVLLSDSLSIIVVWLIIVFSVREHSTQPPLLQLTPSRMIISATLWIIILNYNLKFIKYYIVLAWHCVVVVAMSDWCKLNTYKKKSLVLFVTHEDLAGCNELQQAYLTVHHHVFLAVCFQQFHQLMNKMNDVEVSSTVYTVGRCLFDAVAGSASFVNYVLYSLGPEPFVTVSMQQHLQANMLSHSSSLKLLTDCSLKLEENKNGIIEMSQ